MISIHKSWQIRMGVAALWVFSAIAGVEVTQAQAIRFTNATKSYKVPGNMENGASCYGHGVAMADVNEDGRPDIYITNAVRYADDVDDNSGLADTFYGSVPGGYQESDGSRSISDQYGWTGSHGIVFFDYDNDGDYDLYNATTDDRNRLYGNRGPSYSKGAGYYEDVTDAAGLPLIRIFMADFDSVHSYAYGTRGVAAFDANNDGWMDLYAANWGPAEKRYAPAGGIEGSPIVTPVQPNEFYLNLGNGRYQRVMDSGATPDNPSWMGTQGVVVVDANEDGNMDIFVAHRNYVAIDPDTKERVGGPTGRSVYNQLFFGDGTGRFTENARGAGLNTNPRNDCNGATFADYDNDGDYDAFVVPKDRNSSEFVRVYRNDGRGNFSDITGTFNFSQTGFSMLFLDADNDGDLDIAAPRTRDYTKFYRNNGNGTFSPDESTGLRLKSFDPRGSAIGDVDGDGDLDIYYADANKDRMIVGGSYPDTIGNHLFINNTVTSNRWLEVTGRGPKGDMGGFGSKIWVYDRGHMDDPAHLVGYRQVLNAYGYLCQDDPVQHFGLAQRDSVDVKVRLLDKTELRLFGVPAKKRLFFSRPAQIAGSSGDGQTVDQGMPLPQPLRVRVRNEWGDPVFGAAVTFTALAAGGSFPEGSMVHTDAQGYAQVHYQPAAEPQNQTIRASIAGGAAATNFTCTVKPLVLVKKPARLEITGGEGQHAIVGTLLPQPLTVLVRDNFDQPMPEITVTFSDPSGRGQFPDGATAISDSAGHAAVRFLLGAAVGPYEVQARVEGVEQAALFTLQAEAMPNRAPLLLSWQPADSVLFVNKFRIIDFSATAQDADGDSLRFLWLLDGIPAGSDSTFRIYPASSSTGKVEVRISDGEYTVSRSWSMYLITGVEEEIAVISDYALLQNYPNPFNPATRIDFALPAAARVRIWVFSITGQIVRTLAEGSYPSGRHSVLWDGRDDRGEALPSGLYYYAMESGGFHAVKKLLFVK